MLDVTEGTVRHRLRATNKDRPLPPPLYPARHGAPPRAPIRNDDRDHDMPQEEPEPIVTIPREVSTRYETRMLIIMNSLVPTASKVSATLSPIAKTASDLS